MVYNFLNVIHWLKHNHVFIKHYLQLINSYQVINLWCIKNLINHFSPYLIIMYKILWIACIKFANVTKSFSVYFLLLHAAFTSAPSFDEVIELLSFSVLTLLTDSLRTWNLLFPLGYKIFLVSSMHWEWFDMPPDGFVRTFSSQLDSLWQQEQTKWGSTLFVTSLSMSLFPPPASSSLFPSN